MQEKATTSEQPATRARLEEAKKSPGIQAAINDHKGARAALQGVMELRGQASDKIRELKDDLQNLELSFKKGDFKNEDINSLLSKQRQLNTDITVAEGNLQELEKTLLPAAEARAQRAAEAAEGWLKHICHVECKINSELLREKINETEGIISEHNKAISELFHTEKISWNINTILSLSLTLKKASLQLRRIIEEASGL